MLQIIIAVVITLIITAIATWFISVEYHKRVANTKIGNAEEKARGIIDEAVKTAEAKKREATLESKKRPFDLRMSLTKRSRNAETKSSVMSVELSRRKKTWIRRSKRWRSAKPALTPRKKI